MSFRRQLHKTSPPKVARTISLMAGAMCVALLASCAPSQKVVAPTDIKPPPVIAKPKPVDVPCELTDTCPPAPKPPAPYNLMGRVLGDACPQKADLLAAYATCRNGQIVAIDIAIPTQDEAAKQRVFDRALVKYGAPFEDRRGGVPMVQKVAMPDWAADKTPPQLNQTRDKRYMFWWIDEVAKHYLAVSEAENAVEVSLHRLDRAARQRANNLQTRNKRIAETGKQLTEAF